MTVQELKRLEPLVDRLRATLPHNCCGSDAENPRGEHLIGMGMAPRRLVAEAADALEQALDLLSTFRSEAHSEVDSLTWDRAADLLEVTGWWSK